MLALGIRYLTGYAVATNVSGREQAEWPPHPARVFMAMAAAHFETGQDPAERATLEWLEKQGAPALNASQAYRRDVVSHYVPVNDKAGPAKGTLQSAPNLPRGKKERFFPSVRPDDDTVYLLWPDSPFDNGHSISLERLCRSVIRIGHSSSLVQMWVEDDPPDPNLIPSDAGSLTMRVFGVGTLDYLESLYPTRRPAIGLWQPYARVFAQDEEPPPASGLFDRDFLVLTLRDGPVVGLETTWQLLTAMRDTILSVCDPTPEWVSGHRADGSASEQPHLALMPLAFAGHQHADGHLMGIGLAFPKHVPPRERGGALRALLYEDDGWPRTVELKLGALGAWTLQRETHSSPPFTLQSNTWTEPSRTWASVTPIVLDRHPKANYRTQRERWMLEVSQVIAESCLRQGLPEPVAVDVGNTSRHRGCPQAAGKCGFPMVPAKQGQPARQQVHASLQFDQPVEGPLLLGAGRYRGYGLCKPLRGGPDDSAAR